MAVWAVGQAWTDATPGDVISPANGVVTVVPWLPTRSEASPQRREGLQQGGAAVCLGVS